MMKKKLLAQDSDTKLFEYLLLIEPDALVKKRITELKQTFRDIYQCTHAAGHIPHLTMINFLQQESMEFRLINCFEKFAQYVKPFDLVLDGFGVFEPHTIYIKVRETDTFADLVKDMRTKFQRIIKFSDLVKPTYTLKPHLTIARKLTPEQYQLIWEDYKKEHFQDLLQVKEMVLIKREVDPFTLKSIGKFRTVHHFAFLDKQREAQLALLF